MVSIIVTSLLCIVFTKLGMWQLDRAAEKNTMLAAKEIAAAEKPLVAIAPGTSIADIEYQPVELSGYYDYSKQFLLDNRIYKKQAGYEVVTPFFPSNSEGFVLVNRGWVGHNGDRTEKPSIPPATADALSSAAYTESGSAGKKLLENALSEGALSESAPDERAPDERAHSEHLLSGIALTGIITNPSKGFAIGPALEEIHGDGKKNWPLVLQYVDYATIADKVDKLLLVEGVVVADAGQNRALIYNWRPVANGPLKHYGYAFQWFAMLAAVVVLFLYLNFLKKAND